MAKNEKSQPLPGSITLLVGSDYTDLEITDESSSCILCKIRLSPDQLSAILSRQSNVKCDLQMFDLSIIGKYMVMKSITFSLGGEVGYLDQKRIATAVVSFLPEVLDGGWRPDTHFGSKDSFHAKEEGGVKQTFATTNLRKWVTREEAIKLREEHGHRIFLPEERFTGE